MLGFLHTFFLPVFPRRAAILSVKIGISFIRAGELGQACVYGGFRVGIGTLASAAFWIEGTWGGNFGKGIDFVEESSSYSHLSEGFAGP